MLIKEEDIHKIAFRTRYRYYEFMVVLFELTNSPTDFMCLVNNVLHPYLHKVVIVFVNDISVYSRTKEGHEEHLVAVLQPLREHKLYANLSKCDFF